MRIENNLLKIRNFQLTVMKENDFLISHLKLF
jgi:hypothetical protein